MVRAVRIAVDPDGSPWIVTADQRVVHRRGNQWEEMPGRAIDIAIGPDGAIWAIGSSETGIEDGGPVLRWDGGAWEATEIFALSLTVGPDGLPWVANTHQAVHRMRPDRGWDGVPGRVSDLSIGADGSIWAIGTPDSGNPDGSPVLRWHGDDWEVTDGFALTVAVAPDGLPWVVNAHNVLYRLTRFDRWVMVAGRAVGVSVGADGTVWTIGTPEVAKGGVPTRRGRLRPAVPRFDEPTHEYAVAYSDHNFPARLPAGDLRTCWLTVENRGTAVWRRGTFEVAVELDGTRAHTLELPHSVGPGESFTANWIVRVPEDAGNHVFRIELTERDATSFQQRGVPPLDLDVDVVEEPRTETRRLRDLVLETQSRCWLPCDGTSWSATGPGYAIFAREARGCRTTDLEGRVFIDYLMGWGSALLGYAHPRIQQAVAEALSSGAILTLTHPLMVEVAERLCEMFPGAAAATFGKNGSDVCTAAIRLARAHTGRTIVLVCGYHGWQDWHVERFGFAATGVPDREATLVIPFEVNNLQQVADLLDEHRDQVAAVMLEPAAPMMGENEPLRDADPVFLKELKDLAHRHGALVIFDEIMSGFRYPGGSVQHATGVVADLTCLGKALSAGMPLSALVGRKDVFRSVGRIFYEPTFKGEVYSFAAAREALAVYQEEDVPGQIRSFGERLRAEVHKIACALQVPAQVIGPSFRMMLTFTEVEDRRRTLMRTLVNQELFKKGVLTTQNLFLPSTAHDDEALELTCFAFEHALGVVAKAMADDRFASYLEIPPLAG